MEKAIRTLFYFGPLIFAIGFLTPLITQILVRTGYSEIFGLSALTVALIVSGGYGLFAQITGRWI